MSEMIDMPRFCLVGTSNAVFADGYTRVFESSKYLRKFSKHALGFSSSLMFSMMAQHIDFSQFDVCVLDFAVNDGTQLASKITSAEMVRAAVEDAVVRVLDQGCLPALFILPVLSLFKIKNDEIRTIYLKVAEKFNLPVFDGYAYLEHVQASGQPIVPLFKDDMHLTRDVAATLATSFLEGLLIAHRIRAPGRQVLDSGFTYDYLAIDKLGVESSLIRDRRTKLFAAGVADIGGAIRCRVPEPSTEIVGMGVDWANTSGTLEAVSRGGVSLSLNNVYSGADINRFIFGVYPWLEPLAIQDGTVALGLKANEKMNGPERLALGGLVVRRPADYAVTCLLSRPFVVSDALFNSGSVTNFRDVHRWRKPIHYFQNTEDFFRLKSAPNGIYSIKALRTFFDIMFENRKSDTTIVVFHAAIANRSEVKLPFFAGQKLAGAEANVILVSDPALYSGQKLPLAWFAGRKGCPVQPILLRMLEKLIAGLGAKKLIFTGPSGGGFAALYYSYFFPDSLCVPSNPQTIIANFNPAAVAAYCRTCFGASDAGAIENVLRSQIDSSLPEIYARGVPNYVIYCQNSSDDHVELHEEPFARAIPGSDADRVVHVHGNWGTGHIAPPATQWGNLLAAAANWQSGWAEFLETHDFSELGSASRACDEADDVVRSIANNSLNIKPIFVKGARE